VKWWCLTCGKVAEAELAPICRHHIPVGTSQHYPAAVMVPLPKHHPCA